MKNLKTLLAALVLGTAVASARAGTMEDAVTQWTAPSGFVVFSTGGNSPALSLFYIGGATEAVADVTNSSVAFYAPFGTADTGIGERGFIDITASTANTMGKVCNSINNSTNYRCSLLGAKSDDPSTFLRDQTAASNTSNNLKQDGGFQILFDTGGVNQTSTTTIVAVGMQPAIGKRVVLKRCVYQISDTAAALGNNFIRVFGKQKRYEGLNQHAGGLSPWNLVSQPSGSAAGGIQVNPFPVGIQDDRTIVWQGIVTSTTSDTTVDWVDSQSGLAGIAFAKDAHVVVQAGFNGIPQSGPKQHLDCYWAESSQ